MEIPCCVCGGTGKLEEPGRLPKDLQNQRKKIALALKESGYSFREIMKIMNYKSPQSITNILK